MLNQYFGNYLLEKKKITAEQLADVLDYEHSIRVKLGVLAINSGFMNAEQVEAIHQLQRVKDKRFGELAVEKGYVTPDQLEQLLAAQHSRHLGLSQAIIDKGYLTLAQLEEVLAAYKKENELEAGSSKQDEKTLLEIPETDPLVKTYQAYIALLQRNVVRFLDVDPVIGKNQPLSEQPSQWLICQNISGETNLFTALAMDDDTLLEVARKYSGEVLTKIDELARDSAAEFLNMVNGIYCVNASNDGIELDLHLQQVLQNQAPNVKKGYRIPITLPFGKMDVIIGSQA